MTFEEFSARAHQIFEEIPAGYKEGVDGLDALRKTVFHPTLPEVFTLGECLSEFYPSDYGGAGEVRSRVVLYYGSFLELSRRSDEWDWEGELWETITHEVRHHLEHLAQEDDLEEMDYAEDQNFARREGEPFDPFFFQAGEPIGPHAYAVGDDWFLEHSVEGTVLTTKGGRIEIPWGDGSISVSPPAELGDVHYLYVGDRPGGGGDFYVVLVRKRGLGEWLRGILGARRLQVLETEGQAEGL
jgi:hypothetical protein